MRSCWIAAVFLPVAGCMTPPADSASAQRYRAIGTEPFWSVTIEGGAMRFEGVSLPTVTVARPDPRTTFNGHRYETARMTVDVTHRPCSDGMSDRTYPDTVAVQVDGRSFSGCGGETLGAEALAGTHWTIASVDGAAVEGGRPAQLSFTGDRIAGSAGCNRLSGSYRFEHGRLVVGPMIATRMACEPALMEREARVLKLFEAPLTVEPREDGGMALVGGEGGVMVLAPAE